MFEERDPEQARLPGMAEPSSVTLDEAIAEVERELNVRRRVYAEWIEAGKMKRETARRQYARLLAARNFLVEEKARQPTRAE